MISDEIRRLHELHQAGALSDAEFEQAKAKVLAAERVNLDKGAGGASGGFGSATNRFEAQMRGLRRSRSERWLGGVCGGLSVAFGMETVAWRVIFALFALVTSGFGALAYLLLWIFVPEE